MQATLIVQKVHLHILPTMNPDGFTLTRRENANLVDLNRDFPDQVNSLPTFWLIYKSSACDLFMMLTWTSPIALTQTFL